ncbi:MAG: phage major capsid protein [Pseudomonadota bacterium]
MTMRFNPWFGFAAIVAIAVCAVLVFDYSAAAHAHSWGMMVADAGGVAVLEKQLTELATQLKTASDDVKKSAETTQTELKNLGTITSETKKAADEALIKHNEMSARVTEIEQKLVQLRAGGGPDQRKSIGQQVTDDAAVKSFIKSGAKGRVSVQVKAIISSLTTDADGSAGDLIVPQRLPGIITPPQRRMTIRDLITAGRTTSNALQYVKETGFTNNAATVTETAGTAKAQSEMKFDVVTTAVTTIAHWVLATKQILDDVPQLQSYIDGRLRYGLMYVEENQLLNGGGTGTDLNGIYTQATAYSQPIVPTMAGNMTKIDVIRLAMLQAYLAEYPATGIAMHPSDWADIELTKTDEGAYLFANPQNGTEPRLWRLPVVDTQAMTVDKFLVGAFNLGAQIFDREDANVEISTEDSDNFRKNLVTIRAEERLAMAVYRPEAFIKGDFSYALAA